MRLTIQLILIALTILFSSCNKEQKTEPTNTAVSDSMKFQKQTDIAYGNHYRNKMDIYIPEQSISTQKAILFIHGGGWVNGDKSSFDQMIPYYANKGITCVSMNYRHASLMYKIDYKEIIKDIDQAILHLKKDSTQLKNNFSKITLMGHSCGAHLALLYGFTHTNIYSIISVSGPTDLNDLNLYSYKLMPPATLELLGSWDKKQRDNASPINYYNGTPTYIYHGSADTIVPYQQSKMLYEKIAAKNPKNSLVIYPKAGHLIGKKALNELLDETFLKIIND